MKYEFNYSFVWNLKEAKTNDTLMARRNIYISFYSHMLYINVEMYIYHVGMALKQSPLRKTERDRERERERERERNRKRGQT